LLSLPSSGVGRLASPVRAGASTSTELPAPRRAYAEYTGQKLEEIEKAMDRDKFLEADEAKAFGIIDEVFDKRPESGEDSGTGAGEVTPG
jgi:ATP-dependent Clp protease protease subunit